MTLDRAKGTIFYAASQVDPEGRQFRIDADPYGSGEVVAFAQTEPGLGVRFKGVELRDALIKAFPLEGEKSEPEQAPFDPDVAIEEARAYAKNEANAAYGRAFAEFITSVFPA